MRQCQSTILPIPQMMMMYYWLLARSSSRAGACDCCAHSTPRNACVTWAPKEPLFAPGPRAVSATLSSPLSRAWHSVLHITRDGACVVYLTQRHLTVSAHSHGNGLYSCTNPSRADRYATSCLSSPYRVMIACDVVLPQLPNKNNSVS